MASRNERRVERVKTQVPIRHLLASFGYRVQVDGGDREEQFCCDLHGDGHDNKPSARVYPDNTIYCFACGIARDTIALTRAKQDLGFWEAVEWLEQKYNFPPMPFDTEDDPAPRTVVQQIADSIVTLQTFEEIRDQVRKRLDRATKEKGLPLGVLLNFWEDFDRLVYGYQKEKVPEGKVKKDLLLLADSILEKMKEVIRNENSSLHH